MSSATIENKLQTCRDILDQLGSVVIGFSGGVDSTLLLSLAVEQLGRQNVLAALAVWEVMGGWEIDQAHRIVQRIGTELVELRIEPLKDHNFVSNRPDRCYHCKKKIFSAFVDLARSRGLHAVCSGANADDTGDYRPGLLAEKELGIREPLLQAGLGKAEIRQLSRQRDLETWDSPSMACLASRVPYGQEISAEKLRQVEQGEALLRQAGFRQYRLRHHGELARIEVPADQIDRLVAMRESLVEQVRALGFAYVTLDLQGFRSGSMNETLDLEP